MKRRLSEEVGCETAAEIYEKLIRRTLGVACDFKRRAPSARIVLFHTPQDPVEKLKNKFRGPWEFCPQEGEHLGARMANALRAAFATGANKAVLIGTDLADIEATDIEGAFRNIGKKVRRAGSGCRWRLLSHRDGSSDWRSFAFQRMGNRRSLFHDRTRA